MKVVYTLLYGLKEAINMIHEEGLDNVFHRHERHAQATRAAVQAWGFDIICKEEKDFSNVLTAVMLPEGHNADNLRKIILGEDPITLPKACKNSVELDNARLCHSRDAAYMCEFLSWVDSQNDREID